METITENDLKERIVAMETQYKEITSKLQTSQKVLFENEHEMLVCLQNLMPLQNAFFRSIIENLQKQLKDRDQHSADPPTTRPQETRVDNVYAESMDSLPV
jgi:hypothetical protein